MNKQLIQNILYAGHCIGICSDWSEQAINRIIDTLKDTECVYNEGIIDEEKLDELAQKCTPKTWAENAYDEDFILGFKAGYRKAMEDINNHEITP